jgi:hypothetical protein
MKYFNNGTWNQNSTLQKLASLTQIGMQQPEWVSKQVIILNFQLRAKLNYEGRSWTWSSQRLTKDTSGSHLMTHVLSRNTVTVKGWVRGLIPTHPVNISCWRKPEYPAKSHEFRYEFR